MGIASLIASRPGRFIAIALGGVLALGLGGCNKDKDTIAGLQQENAQLKSENESLQQNTQQLQAQNQQLLGELANIRNNPPAPVYDAPTGGGGGRPPAPRGGGGGEAARLTVAGDVLFPSGKAELTSAGRRELDGIASTLKSRYRNNQIRVEGYTDKHPIKKSNWGSNEALSAARASAVEKYLISKGISGSRIESVGMGSTNLKRTDAASRRVEIVVMN